MSESRTKLEQILELLLAEDTEQAEEMLHEYVVSKARSEYEKVLDESEEDEVEESAEEEVDESFDEVEEAIDDSDAVGDFESDIEETEDEIEEDEYDSWTDSGEHTLH